MYLDYGTNYDSGGKHVDMFGVTVIGRLNSDELVRKRFVIVYTKGITADPANKNWHTTMLCLRELVCFVFAASIFSACLPSPFLLSSFTVLSDASLMYAVA